MQKLKKLLYNSRILIVLLLLAVFAGCSDDDDKGSTARDGTLEKLFSYPVIQGCSTCHYGSGSGPDLSKASFTSQLTQQNATNYTWDAFTDRSADCDGVYVTPYSTSNSSILKIVTNQNGTCGALNYHTTHNAEVTGAALNELLLWIENGTPAN